MTGGATSFMSAALPVLAVLACIGTSHEANSTHQKHVTAAFEHYEQELRKVMDDVFAKIPPSVRRELHAAEISATCSIGLLKMLNGIRNLEPWALRLLDASGKYPTGFLDGAKVDLGAFDECLYTTLRDEFGHPTSIGQYCSLKFYTRNGKAQVDMMERIMAAMHPQFQVFKENGNVDSFQLLRIGICVLDDCTRDDLQALIDTVKPSNIDIEVANCVTHKPQPWTHAQISILIFLASLATIIAASTVLDLALTWKAPARREEGVLCKVVKFFTVTSSTRGLLQMPAANSTENTYRFLHGLRFLSICSVLTGHCGFTVSDTWARFLNLLLMTERWYYPLTCSSFLGVDTFFFLSGFLMCVSLSKYESRQAVVPLVVVPLRLIRTLVPAFFVMMCIYLVPLMASGPDLGTFMHNFQKETSEHWWHFLAQVRNFYTLDEKSCLAHYWFLSADFQAFLVSFPVYLLFKNRKSWAIATFTVMSLVSCGIATWQIAGTDNPPFAILPARTPQIGSETINNYYILPFYHLVCYFSGCIVFFLTEDFNKRKPSKALQTAGWCVAACCGLCVVFQKLAWYRNPMPTTELGKLCTAFFDRILWSLFLSWMTLACGSGRGGFVGEFLSWDLFVPLSRLSFGVYLIHLPFLEMLLSLTRERLHHSLFNQSMLFCALMVWSVLLSYVLYVACEAPTAKLNKLLFEASLRKHRPPGRKSCATHKELSETVTKA